jgi:trehalose synthase
MKRPQLADYAAIAGPEAVAQLGKLARSLKDMSVVHVNSTRSGGGVAEILARLIPLMQEMGIRASWEVIEGNQDFFAATKGFHNGLQGTGVNIPPRLLEGYAEVNRVNAEAMRPVLEEADFVFVHDPQPAALLRHLPRRRGKWIWRCHIDVSRPYRPVWKFLRPFITDYDASIFSLADFVQPLKHPQYLIAPSIDPLSEKNMPLDPEEVSTVAQRFHLDPEIPVALQVSRFDRFKDPVGVINAYRMVREHMPLQLVLAGGAANDDPEGAEVLADVRQATDGDPNIHVLLLPSDAHRDINALQRRADIVLQKSLREGFGLTVTEALWKGKPVIGGETGGITLQVVNHHTGFLVNTPEGAAMRMRYLLNRPRIMTEMGEKARTLVRENFLLTRHLREYLTLMLALRHGASDRVEIY